MWVYVIAQLNSFKTIRDFHEVSNENMRSSSLEQCLQFEARISMLDRFVYLCVCTFVQFAAEFCGIGWE